MQAVLLPLPGVGATIRPLVRADAVDVVLSRSERGGLLVGCLSF